MLSEDPYWFWDRVAKAMISLLMSRAGCACFVGHTYKRVEHDNTTRRTSYCPLVCFALPPNAVLFQ